MDMNSQPFPPAPNGQPTNPFVTEVPVKRKKWPLIVISIALVLVVAGTTLAYFLFFQPEKVETTGTSAPQDDSALVVSEDLEDLTAEKVIAQVRTDLNDELRETNPGLSITAETNAPAYNAPDTKYFVSSSAFGFQLAAQDTDEQAKDADKAIAKVASESIARQGASFKKTLSEFGTTYQSKSIICSVPAQGQPLYISCANIAEYDQLIKDVAPFAAAFLASPEGKKYTDAGITFGQPKTTQNANGYSNSEVSITSQTGFVGLFYNTGENTPWKYWQGVQASLSCKDYNTDALKKAFEGSICYDEKGRTSSVKAE